MSNIYKKVVKEVSFDSTSIDMDDDEFIDEEEDEEDEKTSLNPSEEEKSNIVDSITFDDIIGYDSIKKQLRQILGFIKDSSSYVKLGANPPKGIFLIGNPGLGKTMLSAAFINASGLPYYILHKNGDDKTFQQEMARTFEEARKNSPSIILLDDIDKFSGRKGNKDTFHTLQSLMDSVRKENIYIIATCNNDNDMPQSLLRPGRFDFRINVSYPTIEDKERLMESFLKGKKISKSLTPSDISAAMRKISPIGMKTTINKAVLIAASKKKDEIGVEDFLEAILEVPFDDGKWKTKKGFKEICYHEAGHALVAEVFNRGNIGFISAISSTDNEGMTISIDSSEKRRPHEVITCLAGKASVELNLPCMASGCADDIDKAYDMVYDGYIQRCWWLCPLKADVGCS